VDTPAHVARFLNALHSCGNEATQNDPAGWTARCPGCGRELQIRDVDWDDSRRRVRLYCATCDEPVILKALGLREPDLFLEPGGRNGSEPNVPVETDDATIVTLEDFVAVDEPGAAPLLGDEHGALIAEGSDVMVYGDGGAGKTTLLFDLAFHLAAGRDWLGFPIARPVRVLLIENEGPRPLLRNKLKRKLELWDGAPLGGRVSVFEHPWGQFTFAKPEWRTQLADRVRELEVDVIIAGPLTRLGMDSAGTLQEVAAFMRLVDDVRQQSGRALTPIIAHHENKGGAVSGAWEGAGDTLLHVQAAGNGHTVVYIAKARWASAHHHRTLKLAWTDGEGFELEGDRDYVAEVRELLSARPWLTAKEIAKPEDEEGGGIGASEKTVRAVLDQHMDLFESRTGDAAKALGRQAKAIVWGLSSGLNSVDSVGGFQGGAEGDCVTASPLKGRSSTECTPAAPSGTELTPQLSAFETNGDRA
jgi:hypothetical protein